LQVCTGGLQKNHYPDKTHKSYAKEPLTIYYPKGLCEHSKFWSSIVHSANLQACVFKETQPDFKTADADFAQVENANEDG